MVKYWFAMRVSPSITEDKKMEKIRIGILGCAKVAKEHIVPAILKLHDYYSLVAVASRNDEKALQFSSLFGCEALLGYDTLINRADIDAIYVPLPSGLHKEWINKALMAGKHVYAEKSIAMKVADAEEMIRNANQNELALMEGYMFQYHDQHRIVKKLLKEREIGDIRLVRASFGFPPLADHSNFRYDANIGGGALYDVGGYVWRAINYLLGNSFEIKASNIYFDGNNTSIYGSAFVCTNDGISGELSFGFDNYYQCNYEIWGSQGKIICPKAFTPKENELTSIIVEKQGCKQILECPPCNHFVKSMEEFYNICIHKEVRQRHYSDIIYQIKGLEQMSRLNIRS